MSIKCSYWTQLHLKLSSSRNSWQVMLRIFNHPEKVIETAWHPQLQINLGHYKCTAMDFFTFLIWYLLGQSGMISKIENVKIWHLPPLLHHWIFEDAEYSCSEKTDLYEKFATPEKHCKHYKHCQGFYTIICLPRTWPASSSAWLIETCYL